jgi:cyclopropane fatty-acyl-phospholipid synthase-like methyltransferase
MAFRETLNQSRFPRLWTLFQILIGGLRDKRALCLLKYRGQRDVLEVGCSVGTIAAAFLEHPDVLYTGLDIDESAIRHARRAFRNHANFTFVCQDLRQFATGGRRFGYLLLAGVCHHLDEEELRVMLRAAASLLAEDGQLVVVDPVLPEPGDPRFFTLFLQLEQGHYVRTNDALGRILEDVRELTLVTSETHVVGASPLSIPVCARFGVYVMRRPAPRNR